MKFKIGDIIGSYRLTAECGQGAYGEVFLAESTVTRRRVALKIVFRHGRNCERELRGLAVYHEICRRTDLLQIYHVEDCGEYFYYTMDAADDLNAGRGEYVPDTLANRLRVSGRLPAETVRKMADEITLCLNTLHDRGLMHRDVKPDNILWIDGMAKPGDIGLVAADGSTVLAGTPGFLPPEVLAGTRDCEPQDDFYALGKAVYCALTGRPVEEYPSFPDSRTLGDCGDLIRFYNRLCGEKAPSEGGVRRKSFRKRALWFAVATIVIFCIGSAAWFTLRSKFVPKHTSKRMYIQQTAQQRIASLASSMNKNIPRTKKYDLRKLDFLQKLPTWAASSSPWYNAYYLGMLDLPEVAEAKNAPADDKWAVRVREVDALYKNYALSPEFFDILPMVVYAKINIYLERGNLRRNSGVSAGEEFFDKHREDPELQFDDAMAFVMYYSESALKKRITDSDFQDYIVKLKKEFVKRKKLEPILLEKYKGAGASPAVP